MYWYAGIDAHLQFLLMQSKGADEVTGGWCFSGEISTEARWS